jgi:hypothetical protein
LAVPNGAARPAARSAGALAGRNLALLFWVTLFSDGSSMEAASARRHPRQQHQPSEPHSERTNRL